MELCLKYYTDPGHGWIAVKRKMIDDLGIADQITAYSYVNGQTVYLEEDCDAVLLIQSLKKTGITVKIEQRNTNNRSPIRSYTRFKPL